jgi:serine/threonine protein kinase/WD40 repeat protein
MLGLALGDSSKDENDLGAPASEPKASDGKAKDAETDATSPTLNTSENFGDRIAGYRLLQEIGQGGCGVVYMAEQEKPVHRRVALKVIKLGMDTKQVVARFEAERQAVAQMDHPNIAKVLDAGATGKGRPYFAMELVGGLKITDYCDINQLTTTERLQLFVQVCRAIQHAHQKGIIHRDIKPSNVLVAQHDGVAVPKVIDFGIAKATQGKLTDQTLFTAFEQFIGTPVYMSPEQAELGGLDVDTRSDIYSLGVLLYELLTGKTPFQMDSSKAAGVEAIRRTVVKKEPIKPSTRLSTMREEQLTNVARARQIDAPKLLKLIRGDLDWIVMKCLEKDRGRRYETANGLAMDIERYLGDEPVLARPPSTVYQLRKFVTRNRLAALSTVAISLSLILGTIVSTWEAIKATRAEKEQSRLRQEAQAAKKDATEKLWGSYAAEARARRLSRESGMSFESLAAIQKAAAIRPSLKLRNEAIAALAQADIRWLKGKTFNNMHQAVPNRSGTYYVTCDDAGAVTVRNVSDDRERATLPAAGSRAVGVWTISPTDPVVVVRCADGSIRVWNWEYPRVLFELPSARTAQFTPDGKKLVVLGSEGFLILDLIHAGTSSPRALENSTLDKDGGWGLWINPNGKLLAAGSGQGTNLWIVDLDSGQTVRNVPHSTGISALAWSPDGNYFATADMENSLRIWDAVTARELRRLPSNQTVHLEFDPRGDFLVSSGWDGRTRLWDFLNGRLLAIIYNSGPIIGFSPDGSTMIESHWEGDGLEFFEIARPRGLQTLYAHETPINAPGGTCAFSHNGRVFAFPTAERTRLWDVEMNAEIGEVGHAKSGLIGFDAEDQHLILSDGNSLTLWPLPSGAHSKLSQAMPVTQKTIGGYGSATANGEYCFISGSNRCEILSTRSFTNPVTTGIHLGARYTSATSDGSLLASGPWIATNVVVWNGHTGEKLKTFPLPPKTTANVLFSPDDHYLVIGTREEYTFWKVGSWTKAFSIPQAEHNDFVPIMAFSADGRLFAGTHSRNIARIHDAKTGEVLADLEPPDPRTLITSLAFNPDGSRLGVCEGIEAIRIWDLAVIRSHLATMGLEWQIASNSFNQASAK